MSLAEPRATTRQPGMRGALRTIGLMWWLRLRFFVGDAPARLARTYDGERG